MALLGIDCATTSGLAFERKDGSIRAYTFRPRAKRAFDVEAGAIDYEHRGKVSGEWRDHLRTLIATMDDEGDPIAGMAIEMPLRPNITFKKQVVNFQASFHGQAITHEEKGGTNMATMYGLYGMHAIACEVFATRNIPIKVCNQTSWRSSFFRGERPPRGTEDPGKWWKNHAKKYCEMLKIPVPSADAAEAVGILYWLKAQVQPKYREAEGLFAR